MSTSPVQEAVSRTAVTSNADVPAIGATEWYLDPALWALEKDRIFAKSWQYAVLTTQIPNPGDYVTCRLGSIPVVVVRAETGDIHAFVNICRHRGHEVVADASGTRKSLQCRYHGWTYGLDGKLRVARRSEQDPDFAEKCPEGLFSLKVEVWGAFVFVNPDLDAPRFSETYGEWQQLVLERGIDIESVTEHERRSYSFECNWKVLVENTLECYHCALCHPGLAYLRDVTEDVWFEEHEYFSVYGAPTRTGEREDASPYVKEAADEPDAVGTWLWPNTFIALFPGTGVIIATAQSDPFDIGRSVYARQYCFVEGIADDVRRDFMDLFDQVVNEDQSLCESVQRGFHSGYYVRGPLMPRSEPGLIHFDRLLQQAHGLL